MKGELGETREALADVSVMESDAALTQRPIRVVWGRLSKALGLHPHAAEALAGAVPPSANALAERRTDLALERSYLASERTLMAWIRTALSMISFGFTIGKIGEAMQDNKIEGLLGTRSYSISNIAYFLVILGISALLGAMIQHFVRVRALYHFGFPRQFSIAQGVAMLLAFVGGFALTALVLEL
jgi:putative membrane protein